MSYTNVKSAAILLTLCTAISSCLGLRGLLLESAGARGILVRSGSVRAAGSARAVQAVGRVNGRSVRMSASAGELMEVVDMNKLMPYLRSIRMGSTANGNASLFIVEGGETIEVARAIGITRRGETVVQLFESGKSISRPFALPGKLYKTINQSTNLYTGRGEHFRTYVRIQKNEPVFVLEKLRDNWYYVQYQNIRGYLRAKDLLEIILKNAESNIDPYEWDPEGLGDVCFTNFTNKTVDVLFCQMEPSVMTNCGTGNLQAPMATLRPYESACLVKLPVSMKYEFQVFNNPTGREQQSRFMMDATEIDKGGILLEKDITRYYNITDESTDQSMVNMVHDNDTYRTSLAHPMTGDLGFKNNTQKPVSVILCKEEANWCSEGNFNAPEYLIYPGQIKYFFQLDNGIRYSYKIYNKIIGVSRHNSWVYSENVIETNFFERSQGTSLRMIGGGGNNESQGFSGSDITFDNKSGKSVVVYLCDERSWRMGECSPGDMSAVELVIKAGETKSFYGLQGGQVYEYAMYRWREGVSRFEFLYFSDNKIKTGRVTVTKSRPEVITIR